MSKKKWIVTTGAFLLVALLATGYLAMAAEFGSQEDPLVTLSYITDVLSPDTIKSLEEAIAAKVQAITADMDAKLAGYSEQLDGKIAELEGRYTVEGTDDAFVGKVADAVIEKMGAGSTGGGTAPAASSEWKVVKVDNGKTMMLELGAEVVLRIGTGVCTSTGSTGLINLSSGTTIGDGAALAANNLYLVTIAPGRGVKATSAMTVLVRGGYTIQ